MAPLHARFVCLARSKIAKERHTATEESS